MDSQLPRRNRDESGATAVEYGLLVAGVAALVVLIVFSFGGVVKNGLFGDSCDKLKSKTASASCTR